MVIMSKCMVLLFVLAVCSVQLYPVSAASYYVATTGQDFNDGSLSSPFLTIQNASDIMTAVTGAHFCRTDNRAYQSIRNT